MQEAMMLFPKSLSRRYLYIIRVFDFKYQMFAWAGGVPSLITYPMPYTRFHFTYYTLPF